MKLNTLANALVLGALATLVACGGEDSLDPNEPVEIDPNGSRYTYVIDSANLPGTATEASQFALDLDGDDSARPDNALGYALSAVFGFTDTDGDAAAKAGLVNGRIVQLLEIQTTSFDDAGGVGATMWLARDLDDDPSDNFSGDERFGIDDSVATQPLSGHIMNGRMSVSLGAVPIRVALPHVDDGAVLTLEAARIEAYVSAEGITGRLGGVIPEQEIDTVLIPLVHTSVSASVALDCVEGRCEADSDGQLMLEVFDVDGDGLISIEEVRDNSIVQALLRPDLDMFDDGELCVRCDGEKDSLSVGLWFSAVPARR